MANDMSRSHCFSVNSHIVRISENGNLQELMNFIKCNLASMNLVNLSTALHRLAKLGAKDAKILAEGQKHDILQELLSTLCNVYGTMDAADVAPQSLSNVAWSLAILRIVKQSLHEKIAKLALMKMPAFKPFELSNILWSMAKVIPLHTHIKELCDPVFQAAADQIVTQTRHFNFRCLATLIWAFATAKYRHVRLFNSIASSMVLIIPSANAQELSNTAWGFGTAHVRNDALLSALADRAIHEIGRFKPQELANIVWGFATNNFYHEGFYSCVLESAQHMALKPQHLANIIWGFSRVGPRTPLTHHLIIALLPSCTWQLEEFKPQEVSSVARAVAAAFAPSDDFDQHDGQDDIGSSARLPAAICDFLVSMLPWATKGLPLFPVHLYATIVGACVRLDADEKLGLASYVLTVESELIKQVDDLDPPTMLYLLKALASSHLCAACSITAALYNRLGSSMEALKEQNIQMLAAIVAKQLGHNLCDSEFGIATENLRESCHLLANQCRYPAMNKVSANNLASNMSRGTSMTMCVQGIAKSTHTQSDLISQAVVMENHQTHDFERKTVSDGFAMNRHSELSVQGPVEHAAASGVKYRVCIKNSFLHFEEDQDFLCSANGKESVDGDSSQRSSSLPCRTDRHCTGCTIGCHNCSDQLLSVHAGRCGFACGRQLPVLEVQCYYQGVLGNNIPWQLNNMHITAR